jgi:hypothetical protein
MKASVEFFFPMNVNLLTAGKDQTCCLIYNSKYFPCESLTGFPYYNKSSLRRSLTRLTFSYSNTSNSQAVKLSECRPSRPNESLNSPAKSRNHGSHISRPGCGIPTSSPSHAALHVSPSSFVQLFLTTFKNSSIAFFALCLSPSTSLLP